MAKNFLSTFLGLPEKIDIQEVELDEIVPNPQQPRDTFDDDALRSLAESIKDLGVIQPIVLRRPASGRRFELVAGERRLRAARLAGLRKIPAIVKDISPDTSVRLALVENLQRENLSPIEEARAFAYLRDQLNLSQTEIAHFVGKSQPLVSNTLRLLNLPEEIRNLVAEGVVTRGQARQLLKIKDAEQQLALARRIQKKGLQLSDLQEIIDAPGPKTPVALRPHLQTLKSTLTTLRRNGAAVDTSEADDGSHRTLRITLRIPKSL